MSIKNIKIKNLLSFDELYIKDFKDINCIVGKNNVGKSNLLKLIRFFYNKLDGKRELPPSLNSNYSSFGTIELTFDTTRIKNIVTSQINKDKSKYFKHIYNVLFKDKEKNNLFDILAKQDYKETSYTLTLQINSDDSTKWLNTNQDILKVINYLYPFFEIEVRHLDLYDWNKLWHIVSRLKSFDINKIKQEDIVKFFNKEISLESNNYKDYVSKIELIVQTDKYSYREKVLNYIKAGLKGQTFLINEQSLKMQSDGTNAHKFIEIALELLITLSRREYISPTIYIDEPELGLHPKRNEELIYKLYDVYKSFQKIKKAQEKGKQKTPYPKIIFATHSPNIVREVIKLFNENQQILHFSKNNNENTKMQKMNSIYDDKRFLNIFSDNEARLFFSNFILFVEGETELEIFSNKKLLEKFPKLKQIDVYKSSSNVLGSYINPAYSNTSIPYLFLFDADKIYSFRRDKSNQKIIKIKLENKNSNLYILPNGKKDSEIKFQKIIDKYKKGYIGKKYPQQKYKEKLKNLQKIKELKNKEFTYDKVSFTIKEKKEFNEVIKTLRDYLIDYKIKFLHTTTEEMLINKKTENIFFSWLKDNKDIKIETFLYDIKDIKYTISVYKQRMGIGYIRLLKPRKRIKRKITYKYRKHLEEIEKYLIDYLRVKYFNGKFEILTNKIVDESFTKTDFKQKQINEFDQMKKTIYSKLKNFGIKSDKQKQHLEKIFNAFMKINNKNLEFKINKAINQFPISNFNKTSGWTTEFLNYAIDEVDKIKGNKSFRDEFKLYFEELYDIISYIENRL